MVENEVVSLADQTGTGMRDIRRGLALQHPIGRLGDAGEITDAVLFPASDRTKFITGTECAVDRGYTAK